jgi:hypothetical protein
MRVAYLALLDLAGIRCPQHRRDLGIAQLDVGEPAIVDACPAATAAAASAAGAASAASAASTRRAAATRSGATRSAVVCDGRIPSATTAANIVIIIAATHCANAHCDHGHDPHVSQSTLDLRVHDASSHIQESAT